MSEIAKITLEEWDRRYEELRAAGMVERPYGGLLRRHVECGDTRLTRLSLDGSAAALRLWNFLLTEEDRLREARSQGKKILGTMKDLGTIPVMAYSLDKVVAFYPDGAWWLPCIKENRTGLLAIADRIGVDESFCPVRAMLGAFIGKAHFPIPDLLTCSVGATCDDFTAIAQRLVDLGHPIVWWEVPHRRRPEAGEDSIRLSAGFDVPVSQVAFVRSELERVRRVLEDWAGQELTDERLRAGIARANRVRRVLGELRWLNFTSEPCPLPSLEMMIAEMLSIHFCSDQDESLLVLEELLEEVRRRVANHEGVLPSGAVRVFWVNPVADLWVMNLLEEAGGRICGNDIMFCHALDLIPEELPPLEALARMALSDPMVGSSDDRAERICSEIERFGAEAVVISRIPGASHCALEGAVIGEVVRRQRRIPVVEIEVPPLSDSLEPSLRTRLGALVEIALEARLSRLGESDTVHG